MLLTLGVTLDLLPVAPSGLCWWKARGISLLLSTIPISSARQPVDPLAEVTNNPVSLFSSAVEAKGITASSKRRNCPAFFNSWDSSPIANFLLWASVFMFTTPPLAVLLRQTQLARCKIPSAYPDYLCTVALKTKIILKVWFQATPLSNLWIGSVHFCLSDCKLSPMLIELRPSVYIVILYAGANDAMSRQSIKSQCNIESLASTIDNLCKHCLESGLFLTMSIRSEHFSCCFSLH